MPIFLEEGTNANPYAATVRTQRAPPPDGAGRVGAAQDYLEGVVMVIIQTSAEIALALGGAAPYLPFLANTTGGAYDIVAGDYLLIDQGPYAGTYRVAGTSQFGSDHTQVVAERYVGT